MRETILGVVFTAFMMLFFAGSCWLAWEKTKARHEAMKAKRLSRKG